MKCESNRDEYITFFTKWMFYQFPRASERMHNILVIREVAKIVCDDDEAAYWGGRDCWTMHDMANKALQGRAIVGIEA